jgi:hypothetical protein
VAEIDSFLTGKRGVSLPFSDYCMPLVSDPDQVRELTQAVSEFGAINGWRYFESRGEKACSTDTKPSATYLVHTLDLTKSVPDDIWRSFRGSTRRNIRKSLEKGVSVKILRTESSVMEFCRLNQMTRKRHGIPPQPRKFFEAVYDCIIAQRQGFVILALYKGRAIGAAMFFHFGRRGIYKFGASDTRFYNLRPNNLIMWEAIRWFVANGYEDLSFGRTDPNNSGLRQFKMGWGVAEDVVDYHRYSIGNRSAYENSAHGALLGRTNRLFSMMPLPFLRAVGSLLYKHVG